LDILLRDLSDGKYGTQDLMKDLATKYGKNKSFDDADLFKDIEKFTYPEIGTFLRKHVSGTEPLPMREVLEKIGIDFAKETVTYEFSLGNTDLNFNENTNRLYIAGIQDMDEFGKAMGYKVGDELGKLNGKEIKMEAIKEIINNYYETVKEGDKVTIEIFRPKSKKGKYKVKTLSAVAKKNKTVRKNQIALKQKLSDKQKQTLRAWVGA
jgi:predicted metalloprotease with PDZ domain